MSDEKISLTAAIKRLGRPVAYYPTLAWVVGVKEAVFLCQLLYWTPRVKDDADGWIYKSTDEIAEETGLNYKEQRGARERLMGLGVLEERHDRAEHTLYFRVVTGVLDRLADEAEALPKTAYAPGGAVTKRASAQLPKGQVAVTKRAVRSIETETTPETTDPETTHGVGVPAEPTLVPLDADGNEIQPRRRAKKAPRRSKVEADLPAPVLLVLHGYAKLYAERHGGDHLEISWGRDGDLAKALLVNWAPAIILELAEDFLNNPLDKFLADAGRSFVMFHVRFNALAAARRRRINGEPEPGSREAELAHAADEGEAIVRAHLARQQA